jgi:hypothetical protein
VYVRDLFWLGNVPFLFLPRGAHLVSFRGDLGSPGVFVTTLWKREARAMKVVVIEKRKGFLGMFLRKLYGIRKIEEP